MISHYLKIALRILARHRGFTLINIVGLAMGLTCCLLIWLFVRDELSFDRYHENKGRIVRLVEDFRTESGNDVRQAVTAPPMGPALMEEYPEVLEAVRLDPDGAIVRYGEKLFEENELVYADANVFKVFSFRLQAGDPATALKAPNTVVITEKIARKYFGDEDPMGKILEFDNADSYTVTGIVEEPPLNGHIYFDLLASFATWEAAHAEDNSSAWFWNSFYTYLLLPEGNDYQALEARLSGFVDRRVEGARERYGDTYRLSLEPLTSIYLHSTRDWQFNDIQGSSTILYVLSVVGLFLLFIAAINFINLTTARAGQRAREIGMRKVLGGSRRQLVGQFLGEAVLVSMGGLAAAVVLTQLALPYFNTFTAKQLVLSIYDLPTAGVALLLALFVGLLAGSYPAFVLAGFRPLAGLKGKFKNGTAAVLLRRGLVVFQFAVTVTLIVGAAFVYKQIHYLTHRDLGFETAGIAVLNFGFDDEVQQNFETIKRELARHPAVEQIAGSLSVPGRLNATLGSEVETPAGAMQGQDLNAYMVDYDYLPLYGIQMAAGRPFSREYATDTAAFILNESAVRQLGYTDPQQAIGRRIVQNGSWEGRIIGVVKDFNYLSLHKPIEPLSMYMKTDWFSLISLKLRTGDMPRTLRELEQIWKRIIPQRPFDITFQEEFFNRQYEQDRRVGSITVTFAFLAILIACMGLLGLATFAVEQRTKEIGVRKVLGASVDRIVLLLSGDFVRLVLIGVVIAAPVSWYLLGRWLRQYAYQTTLDWWVFLAGGALAVLIAVLTIGYHTVRAALRNPVEALRYE